MADETWEGDVTAVIPAPIDKVWPILADFDGFQKNFPQIVGSCETTEGEKNTVGSIRALKVPLPGGKGIAEIKERLTVLDNVNHTTTYIFLENSFGYTGYKGTITAKSTEDGQTSVVWSFGMNPTTAVTKEGWMQAQHGLFSAFLNVLKATYA